MFVLIDEERQRAIAERVKAFLEKKYGSVEERERYLPPSQIGKLHYLPVGIEEEEGFMHKVFDIIEAYRRRKYSTPILVVNYRGKKAVVDGYARATAAYLMKIAWKALELKVNRKPSFYSILKKDIGRLYKRYINETFIEWAERLK